MEVPELPDWLESKEQTFTEKSSFLWGIHGSNLVS